MLEKELEAVQNALDQMTARTKVKEAALQKQIDDLNAKAASDATIAAANLQTLVNNINAVNPEATPVASGG